MLNKLDNFYYKDCFDCLGTDCFQKCIEARLQSGKPPSEQLTDELLVNLFEEYLRLTVLLHKPVSLMVTKPTMKSAQATQLIWLRSLDKINFVTKT